MFNPPEIVINFVFLQFSGPRLWYVHIYKSNDFENNFECLKATFSSPVGNRSLITADVYDKRWDHII